MAIAVDQPGRRQVTHRPPWVRRRQNEFEGALPLLMVGVLLIGVTAVVLASQMVQVTLPRTLVPGIQQAGPHRPADGATPVAKTAAPALEQPAAEAATTTDAAPALAVGARARVANTDGLGVVFHAAPRASARQPAGLLEGTTVTVLDLADDEWARVQASARQTGWVRAAYLAPAD